VRAYLALVLPCVLTLAGCSNSRRSVKRAPGFPTVFATKLAEETTLTPPEPQDPSSACTPWNGASWCTTVFEGWSFVPEAVRLCASEADEDEAIECLTYAADRSFSLLGLETCEALETPKHRQDCLQAVGDRTLEPPQYAYCTAKPSKEVASCLAGTNEFKFHPNELRELVAQSIDASPSPAPPALIRTLEDNVAQRYELDREEWPENYIFNFAGGATTHIRAMYCALDEYLLIVGAPVNVNGYSGRYPAEVHDFVFTGLMHDFEEHDFESHDYSAGTWAFLPHGGHRVYATETPTYMLEYSRGWIPGMLGFGIRHPRWAITRDSKNMKQQFRMCARRALATSKKNRKRRRQARKSKRQTIRAVRRALRGL
jgi:C-8 sterol isomerase